MMSSFCGTEELCRSILQAIDGDRNQDRDPVIVSPLTVKRVIEAVYAASLRSEEGRYPDFTIAFPLSKERTAEDMAAFCPPLPLSPEILQRIWPAVPPYPHVLSIFEERGEPRIRSIDPVFGDDTLMYKAKDGRPLFKILLISIKGPGDLIALYTGHREIYALQGGRLRRLKALSGPAVSEEANEALDLSHAMRYSFWIPTLQRMIAMRRGGALVCLPPEELSATKLLKNYQENLSVSYVVGQYRNPWQYVNMYGSMRRIGVARSLIASHMSSVDGCVVLNCALEFIGFGGKLRVDVANMPQCIDSQGKPSSFDLSSRGMRHRSAARFAFEVAHSIVVVVSQDGDVHVFRKSEGDKEVIVYGPFSDIPLLSPPLMSL